MTLWELLTTPPPEIEIPFLTQWAEQAETAIMKWVVDQILVLIGWLSTLLLSTPSVFLTSPEFMEVHRVVSLVALAAMLPVLGWMGLRAVMGVPLSEEIGAAVGRMVCASLLMEVSPTAVHMSINLFNNLSSALLKSLPAMTPSHALYPSGLELGLLVFVAVYVFLVVKLVLYYAYRNYALMVLVALSPLVFLLWSLPGQSDRVGKWVREITVLLTTQVVHAIQLIILIVMTVGAGSGKPGLPLLLMQVGGLMFMVKTPSWLADYIHEAPNPLMGVPWKQLRSPKEVLRRMKRAFLK